MEECTVPQALESQTRLPKCRFCGSTSAVLMKDGGLRWVYCGDCAAQGPMMAGDSAGERALRSWYEMAEAKRR